ncbi:MAG: hypothetical protein ACYSWP_12510 [Planctomycetota bacterium]
MKQIAFGTTVKLEKRSQPQKGFAIILTLVLIVLIGAGLFVLTGISNTMMFQADIAQLRAIEQNLTASGLAWAKQNKPGQSDDAPSVVTQLDVGQIGIADANLSVAFDINEDGKSEVLIKTRCRRGRHTLRKSHKFHIQQ